jgi:hypothetical protein
MRVLIGIGLLIAAAFVMMVSVLVELVCDLSRQSYPARRTWTAVTIGMSRWMSSPTRLRRLLLTPSNWQSIGTATYGHSVTISSGTRMP